MNPLSLRIGLITVVAALSALVLSLVAVGTASAQSFGKDGAIHACYKAKGKNRGALRLVPSARSCRKLRGFRAVSWSAAAGGGAAQNDLQTATGGGERGPAGPQGNAESEGKQGSQGLSGEVEQSLIETVQNQTQQIDNLTKEVTDLGGEVLDLKDTVGETCDQLETVTKQSDEILDSLLGTTVAIVGTLLNVPSPPDPLGTFECS